METSREDFGIVVRSAFLKKGTKQRFSLLALVLLSLAFLFIEGIDAKPLNGLRSIVKDTIYRGTLIVAMPAKGFGNLFDYFENHIIIYKDYNELKNENDLLKNKAIKNDFLILENTQLKKLLEEQVKSESNYLSSRVLLDIESPYINSFVINAGSNKKIKNGLAVLDGDNFIGRIVDVNYFSSTILLISDLNSKIPVVIEPSGTHAILSGRGSSAPTLEFLPPNSPIENENKVYTSGKEGLFSPGIPIGKTKFVDGQIQVFLFSDLSQVNFVNIVTDEKKGSE